MTLCRHLIEPKSTIWYHIVQFMPDLSRRGEGANSSDFPVVDKKRLQMGNEHVLLKPRLSDAKGVQSESDSFSWKGSDKV